MGMSWKTASVVLVCASLVSGMNAGAQTAKAGLGKGVGDLADKYIEQELAIERMRAQAEIEVERARRQRQDADAAARRPAQSASQSTLDVQIDILDKQFPKWDRVLMSPAFAGWMSGKSIAYQEGCKATKQARIIIACLNDFLDAK